jgi:hypothetical protein
VRPRLVEIPRSVAVGVLTEGRPVPGHVEIPVLRPILRLAQDAVLGGVQAAPFGVDELVDVVIRIVFVLLDGVGQRDRVFPPEPIAQAVVAVFDADQIVRTVVPGVIGDAAEAVQRAGGGVVERRAGLVQLGLDRCAGSLVGVGGLLHLIFS